MLVVASLLMHSSLFDSLVFSRTVKQVWTESSKRSGRANANTMTDVEAGVPTSNNGTGVNHHLPQHHPNHHQIHLPLSSNATAKTNAGPLPSVDTSVSATNGVNGNATSTSASNVDKSTENAGGSRRRSVEEHAPSSGIILPASIAAMAAKKQQHKEPQLIHPILLKIPLQFRFGCTGMISNLLFMIIYNMAVTHISSIQASIIYAVVYFFFIPASHLMVSLFVFGWPAKYWASLLSNFPIGLTAMALGGILTYYLDQAGFNAFMGEYIRDSFTFTTMPKRDAREGDEEGEFWNSILVTLVTGVWTYVLSVYVNSPAPAKSHKKEL